ncbi:unnamed protein product, partial [Mycena citricolor]
MTTAYPHTPSSPSLIACTNCRERKTKCIAPANVQNTQHPCERCVRKSLRCQYVMSAARPSPYDASSAMSPSPSSPRQPAPALPYTGPPPTGHSRPRYADGQYPNLSLIRGSNQSQSHHAFTAHAGHPPPNYATHYPMAGEYDNWGTQATVPTQFVPMPF